MQHPSPASEVHVNWEWTPEVAKQEEARGLAACGSEFYRLGNAAPEGAVVVTESVVA